MRALGWYNKHNLEIFHHFLFREKKWFHSPIVCPNLFTFEVGLPMKISTLIFAMVCGNSLRALSFVSVRPMFSRTLTQHSRPILLTSRVFSASPTFTCDLATLFEESSTSKPVVSVNGWVRTIREQKEVSFITLNDGKTLSGVQVVVNSEAGFDLGKITTGSSISVTGSLVPSKNPSQKYEIADVTECEILGCADGKTYPLAKKRHTLEYLRRIAHLRPRTNTISAVARVRSELAQSVHLVLGAKGFKFVHTPIITSSDAEGGGEMFQIVAGESEDDSNNVVDRIDGIKKEIRRLKEEEGKTNKDVAHLVDEMKKLQEGGGGSKKEFFGSPAYLTVSGQLSLETHCLALGDCYNFGPTFRAEKSETKRHLAEFTMLEVEVAFGGLKEAMDNAEELLKGVTRRVLQNCDEDISFFTKMYDDSLKSRLESLVETDFARISYSDAIVVLKEEVSKFILLIDSEVTVQLAPFKRISPIYAFALNPLHLSPSHSPPHTPLLRLLRGILCLSCCGLLSFLHTRKM